MTKQRPTIMVVDDIEQQLNLLFQTLTKHGYRVLVATGGQYVLEQIKQAKPDLILLDVMMPELDGFEVCKLLKANPATSDIPIIFMTALFDSTDEVKGLELGAVDYLRKPFQVQTLLARVKTHLALRQAQQQLKMQNVQLQQEITRRQQLETELRASEQMYRYVVENSNDGIMIIQSGCIQFCNSRMGHILNRSLAELLQLPIEAIIAPTEQERVNDIHQQRLAGEVVPNRYETRMLRQNSQPLDVELSASMIEHNNQPAVLTVVREITERKQTEQALHRLNEILEQRVDERTQSLQASEARFERVIHSINDHVYMTVIQPDGVAVNQYISPNVTDLTGYPREKFVNDWRFWSAKVIHPDDRHLASQHFQQLMAGYSDEIEYRLIRSDGSIIWVRDSGNVESDAGSKTIYGVISNITQRKQAEAEKEEQRQLLQKRSRILETLNVLSASVNKAQTRQQVAQAILTANMSITQASGGILYLVDDENLRLIMGQQLNQTLMAQITEQLAGQSQTLIALETLAFVDELATLPPEASPLHTALLIPVKTAGVTVAMLYLAYADEFYMTDETEILLTSLSEIGGNALQRNIIMETLEQRVADRTRELVALYDVTVLASASSDLKIVLQDVLPKVLEAGQCQAVVIYLLDETQTTLQLAARQGPAGSGSAPDAIPITAEWLAIWQRRPLQTTHLNQDEHVLPAMKHAGYQSYLQVPMRVKGTAVGFLNLFWQESYSLALEEIVLLATIADQLGSAVEIARLRQRAASLAVQEERQRLVRELHDSVTQSIYSQTLLARNAQDALEDGQSEKLAAILNRLGENALHLLKEMRLLLYELRPAILEQEGLAKALDVRLNTVERRSGMKVYCRLPEQVNLPPDVEVSLYRIIIEALNNILKHAAAQTVSLSLAIVDNKVTLTIEDDGCGFEPARIGEGGIGLRSMRERAELLGGTLTITAAPNNGTLVTCKVSIN